MLTVPYFDVDRFIADSLSDPLCQMLAAEASESEQGEIEALLDAHLSYQLAYQHVKPTHELEK